MKNKRYYVLLFSIIATFAFLFGSCKHDGGGGTPGDNNPQLATFKVQFDSSLIQCNENSSSGKVINSKDECKEGDVLFFTHLLAPGNDVKTWSFGGRQQQGNTFTTCTYFVNKDDADAQKVISVSFKATNLTVCFDSDIKCRQRRLLGGSIEIPSGSQCVPDTYIEFEAILKPTETVDCWVVGGKDQKDKTAQTYNYKVNSSDKNENNIIKVSVKKKRS